MALGNAAELSWLSPRSPPRRYETDGHAGIETPALPTRCTAQTCSTGSLSWVLCHCQRSGSTHWLDVEVDRTTPAVMRGRWPEERYVVGLETGSTLSATASESQPAAAAVAAAAGMTRMPIKTAR